MATDDADLVDQVALLHRRYPGATIVVCALRQIVLFAVISAAIGIAGGFAGAVLAFALVP